MMKRGGMKQAVVLIHGIGEQKPMSTLWSFVRAVIEPASDGQDPYWSKPDRMSESFELRTIQPRGGRGRTHFYEYYWAYNVEGTKIQHVLVWLLLLIWRRGKDVPESARSLWLMFRVLTVVLLVLAASGCFSAVREWVSAFEPRDVLVGVIIATIIGILFKCFFVSYLGDAARYCSPTPKNIRLRQSIRSEGLTLLRTLHKRGEYDRIIIVGHSLGSVIGYDLVTRLWQEYNEEYPGLDDPKIKAAIRAAMADKKSPQPAVRDEISKFGEALSGDSSDKDIEQFQQEQMKVWLELRGLGNPWRISDFITLGSPLAHAMLLLAKSKADFEDRKHRRELPTCPPQRDEKGYAYSRKRDVVDIGEGQRFSPLFLHHAAPFAATRWTNLYFPALLGLFGDFVGGPLRPGFGNGIRDVKVRTGRWKGLGNLTLLAHTSYWRALDTRLVEEESSDRSVSLLALRRALALSNLRKYRVSDGENGQAAQNDDKPEENEE